MMMNVGRSVSQYKGLVMVVRAGRKPKASPREPSGKVQRPTMEILNQLNAKKAREEKAVVLAQPHRRGSEDFWLSSAAGRFCRHHGLDRAIMDACDAYLNYERRWAAGYGAPKGLEQHSGGGSGNGPTEAQMKAWLASLNKIEAALRQRIGWDGYNVVRRLVIEGLEIGAENPLMVVSGLAEIAVTLGMLDRNPHPYGG